MRREFRATYCFSYIFCHKMITCGWILVFELSIELYWSAQHDRIYESGTTTLLVAKIWTKIFIHIWVFWRATKLKSESMLITPKYITGTYFGAIVAVFNFCDLGAAPKASPCHLFIHQFAIHLVGQSNVWSTCQ